MSFRFKFHEMKKWYVDNIANEDIFEPASNIHLWRFNKKRNGKISNFLLERVRMVRLIKPISEKYKDQYDQGVYVVLDYDDNWVLFVYPRTKYNIKGEAYPYTFADHYSLPYNSASKTPNQFHQTEYTPNTAIDNLLGNIGGYSHVQEDFKDNIVIDNILQNKFNGIVRESILDMLKLYKTNDMIVEGGSGRSVSVKAEISKKKKKQSKEVPDLDKAWNKFKIEHICICAVKNNITNKYGVSVRFYEKDEDEDEDEDQRGFFFIMNNLNTNTIRKKVINYIMSLYIK